MMVKGCEESVLKKLVKVRMNFLVFCLKYIGFEFESCTVEHIDTS